MEELLRTYAQYVSWLAETIAITVIAIGSLEAVAGMLRVAFARRASGVISCVLHHPIVGHGREYPSGTAMPTRQ